MKTVKQTFEEKLPHYLAQLACHYTETRILESISWDKRSLESAFRWENTPQGHGFWLNIYKTYFAEK